ncbi:restriction endonuclease subunit S [Acinetobacter bereziniae]|uniref:Restriction endonuclease subunit S n=1 Tax=Acinetobacter bereziniae TaxID=106648 RepID=A0A8I1DEA0_ACIBZ|nr:restriction endonuclease subunit S [Acinetobacter bereziniae]QQC84846.1 restriction endonuclease subunit S [Acinetobacter bereziniae]UUN97995.1 restriction endonuclease subunit S [Acinetobacter bereziniae]
MQFKQYPSYKNSGVEWLGDVPEHWNLKRFGYLFDENKKKNIGLKETNVLSLSYGNIKEKNIDDNKGLLPESFETYQIIEPNNIVFRFTDLQNDKRSLRSAISKYHGIITSAYIAVKTKQNADFYNYLFRAYDLQKVFYSMGEGMRQSLKMDELNKMPVVLPNKDEQKRIVSFLDTETARIDNLIAKQEKLIELLEEQRKSIISHAVTKGLNPNAPMKDSGVEWLGEVPEHWIISRVKFNFRNLDSKRIPLTSEERSYRQGVYPYYGASGIIDYVNSFIFEEDLVLFSEDGANLAYRSMPIAFVAKGKYWVNNHAHILKPFDNLTAYWACVLESVDVNLSITGATQPKITAENLGNICISFPPSFEERLSINNYILEESLKIDTLILKQNQLIEKLKEYRASIISHAVTGKIDVREFVA